MHMRTPSQKILPTTRTRAIWLSGMTALLGLTCLGIQDTPWKTQPAMAASKAKPKPTNVTWRDVPPMPRYQPIAYKVGQVPKQWGTNAPPKARKAPQYRPQPPTPTGRHPSIPPGTPNAKELGLAASIQRHYGKTGRQTRLLIETDKPIYKPGQWLWFRAVEMRLIGGQNVRHNQLMTTTSSLQCTLYNPRGDKVWYKEIQLFMGHARSAIGLSPSLVGGEYTLHIKSPLTGTTSSKKITVNQYQPPRIKKKLEFLRKGYDAGDLVEATVTLKRATGPVLANHPLRVVAMLAGKRFKQWRSRTNAKGMALISFKLPKNATTDDGLLTIMATDAGVTESISRPIPLAVRQIKLGFFPEGGQAIDGLPARVYVASRRKLDGKPIDIEGVIKDQSGTTVARYRSFHDGMGRFSYTPKAGQLYTLHITKPVGINAQPLPTAKADGIALQSLDDFRTKHKKIRLLLGSKRPQRVSITAIQHEQLIAHKAINLKEGQQVVAIEPRWQARGIIRVTVWSANMQPLAERLLFRHRDRGLQISIKADKQQYGPRQLVTLTLRVKDVQGKPINHAKLGISVVDDTVLNYADDHQPHWLAQRFLSQQLTGNIHKPNFYFDKQKPKAWRALDLVMGTHGWRGFNWSEVRAGKRPPFVVSPTMWRKINTAYLRRQYNRARKAFIVEKKVSHPPARIYTYKELWQRLKAKNKTQTIKFVSATPKPTNSNDKNKQKLRPSKRKEKTLVQKAKDPKKDLGLQKKAAKKPKDARIPKPPAAPKPIIKVEPKPKPTKIEAENLAKKRIFRGPRLRFKFRARKKKKAFFRRANRGDDDLGAPARPVRAAAGVAIDVVQSASFSRRRRLRFGNAGELLKPARRQRLARLQRERNIRYARLNRWASGYRKLAQKVGALRNYERRFPTRFYRRNSQPQRRTDFRDTVYWEPKMTTNQHGIVKVRFGLNDSITSFRVRTSGWGQGFLGMSESVISSKRPFFMVVKAPIATSADDAMALPLTLRNDSNKTLQLRVRATISSGLKLLENPLPSTLLLPAGEARTLFYPVRAVARQGLGKMSFTAVADGLQDSFEHNIQIQPRGFPRYIHYAGEISGNAPITMEVPVPKDIRRSAPQGGVQLIPAPSTSLIEGLEGMLRMPYGCFEQTSSTNYPNVMILQYLKSRKENKPAIQQKAMAYLQRGYKRLVGYETKIKGFEWFGRAPGHEALTAYGLMQFVQMKKVFPTVSSRMIERTKKWLLAKRDGNGGYKRNSRALDRFGRASKDVTNAYITYALTEAGIKNIKPELDWLQKLSKRSNNPYILALALNAFVNSKRTKSAKRVARKLLLIQRKDGSFRGKVPSITNSYGINLYVETTSLAVLGLLKQTNNLTTVSSAMGWLRKQRRHGRFGSTQATILALQAIINYERIARRPRAPGTVYIDINGQRVAERRFQKTTTGAITFNDIVRRLRPGNNKLKLSLKSKRKLPYSFQLRYFTQRPVESKGTAVSIETKLQREIIRMGETVRLVATVKNKTKKGIPMVLARIRYPGALAPQLWQLKQLKEQKKVDFIETKPRELLLYFTSMPPKASKTIKFDLTARVTGNYNAAASSAYLYYTDDKKAWSEPLRVSVRP